MPTVKYNNITLGSVPSGGAAIQLTPGRTRANTATYQLLWAKYQDLETESPNYIWTYRVTVMVVKDTSLEYQEYIRDLIKSLPDGEYNLIWYEDDVTPRPTYADCRLDSVDSDEPTENSQSNFGNIRFVFSSTTEPT